MMKENKLPLSEFVNEEGFELNRYITHLFECFVDLSNSEHTNTEPAQ